MNNSMQSTNQKNDCNDYQIVFTKNKSFLKT